MAFISEAQRRWYFANKGGGSNSSKKTYKPGTDPVKTLVKQDKRKMNKTIKEAKKTFTEEEKKNIEKYAKTKHDSREKYYDSRKNQYKPERLLIHKKLINKVDNPKALPEDKKKPKAIFIGGLTASGKTSAIAKTLDREEGKPDYKAYPKFIYLNADDFKNWLPEYDGYNAGYLHEESSDIFEEALDIYRKQGKQIIIDATLKNTKNANKKIKEFKKSGYEVVLYGTNIPGEESIKRATARFKRSKRYVPLELIKKNAEPTNKSVLKLRHRADKYAVYNTNVPRGTDPTLIESDKSLEIDRREDAQPIVKTEEEWRKLGVNQSDLEGYDTKKHKKVRVRIK